MKVYVCHLAPTPMSQELQIIIDCNEHLSKWGEVNGIQVTEPVPSLKHTGGLVDLCFNTGYTKVFTQQAGCN